LKPLYKTLSRDAIYPQYEEFIRRYFDTVNKVDDSRLVIPDTPMLTLFNYVENTYYSDHQYYGWYVNLPQRPLLEKELARPFVLMEAGAEAMPDWRLYAGLRWNGIWLNNGHSSSAIEQERIGRPLRILEDSEVELSQAYQGLNILDTVFATRFSKADGINVNLIADGLAEGNYHKGVCDLERKAKLGFFAAQMAYQPLVTSGTGFKFTLAGGEPLHLQVAADSAFWGKPLRLTLQAIDQSGNVLDTREMMLTLQAHQRITSAGDYVPVLKQKGYYVFRYALSERQDVN
jgi:hypothetical protein